MDFLIGVSEEVRSLFADHALLGFVDVSEFYPLLDLKIYARKLFVVKLFEKKRGKHC